MNFVIEKSMETNRVNLRPTQGQKKRPAPGGEAPAPKLGAGWFVETTMIRTGGIQEGRLLLQRKLRENQIIQEVLNPENPSCRGDLIFCLMFLLMSL